MKGLFKFGLICCALLTAACGSVEGGYEGYADVSGGMYGRGEKILSIVEKKGDAYTIDFRESAFIENCKLKIYPSDGGRGSGGGGQTCELTVGDETETLKVDRAVFIDTSSGGLKAFKVIIDGRKSRDGKDVEVIYEGFNTK
jgi:hypothetical protein